MSDQHIPVEEHSSDPSESPRPQTVTRWQFISKTLRVTSAAYLGMRIVDSFLAPITDNNGIAQAQLASPASPSIATDGCTCSTATCLP